MLVVWDEGDGQTRNVLAPVVAWRIGHDSAVAEAITADDYGFSNGVCALHDRRTGLTWQACMSEWPSLDEALAGLRKELAGKSRHAAIKAAKR